MCDNDFTLTMDVAGVSQLASSALVYLQRQNLARLYVKSLPDELSTLNEILAKLQLKVVNNRNQEFMIPESLLKATTGTLNAVMKTIRDYQFSYLKLLYLISNKDEIHRLIAELNQQKSIFSFILHNCSRY